jgi:hypothetical protein
VLLLVLVPAVFVVALVALIAFGSHGTDNVDALPGARTVPPRSQLLYTTKVRGALGAQSSIDRYYGTDAGEDDVVAAFDAALLPLGWTRDGPPEPPGPGDRYLGRYRRGRARFDVIARPLPQRIGGRDYTTGFARILTVRVRE